MFRVALHILSSTWEQLFRLLEASVMNGYKFGDFYKQTNSFLSASSWLHTIWLREFLFIYG